MENIFISYNREDDDKTKALIDDIEELGYTVWFDHELNGGQIWWDKILEVIRNCDVFVFVMSAESLDSAACESEYTYASKLGKTILPILIDEEVSLKTLQPELSKIQFVDYKKQDRYATLHLAKALNSAPHSIPLPDPLPFPPEVPLSYLGGLAKQIRSTSNLSYGEQSTLLLDLKRALNDPESSKDAWMLLKKLRKRDDLLAIISDEIDKLSANILQETMSVAHQEEKSEQKETKKEQKRSAINKKTNKSTADDINNKGIALYKLERYDEAIVEFDKAIALDPDNADIFYNKGIALYDLERYDEAIIEFDKSIALDPNDAEIYNGKGDVLCELELYDEAITEYDKAIAIDPDNADIFYNKGIALYILERDDEAIIEYDKAIAIDPTRAEIFNSKGDLLFGLERYDEAIIEYDKAIAIDPDNADILSNRGFALYILGQYDEALAEYDKAIAIDPDNAVIFYNKAYVYALENNKNKFLQNLKQAIQKNNEYKELAKTDEVLEAYWNDKDFKKIVD